MGLCRRDLWFFALDYIWPVESENVSLKIVPPLSWEIFLAHLDRIQGDPTWDQDWANPNTHIFIMSSRNDIPLMNTKTFYVKGWHLDEVEKHILTELWPSQYSTHTQLYTETTYSTAAVYEWTSHNSEHIGTRLDEMKVAPNKKSDSKIRTRMSRAFQRAPTCHIGASGHLSFTVAFKGQRPQ